MQQHVGLAPHDAGRRARRVEQHRVERRAVPPCRQRGRIGGEQASAAGETEPGEASAHAPQPRGVDLDRDQLQLGIAFEQVRGLATGRGAGIKHARARRQRERVGDPLRGRVLHRDRAILEIRQCRHRHRRVQPQRIGQGGIAAGLDPGREQVRGVRVAAATARVDAQPQRRGDRAGGEDRLGLVAPVALQLRAQPLRPVRVRIAGRQALALGTAQQRVDEPGLVFVAEHARGLDRGRNRGVRGQAERIELREADQQQRTHLGVALRQWPRQERGQRRLEPRGLAQHRETDRLDEGAIARIDERRQRGREFALQRAAAVQHRVEHVGRDRARRGTAAHAPVLRSARPLR